MPSRKIPKESLKPLVAKLDAMEKRARKAKQSAKNEADKVMLGVRVDRIGCAKKCLRSICKAFNI